MPNTMPQLLLIDDDEALGPPLATYLARFGFGLEQALRPSMGVQRLREAEAAGRGFDALVLDVMLPEQDGFELCRSLRRGDAGDTLRGLPILMLTARGDLTDRVVGLELGADDYLPKPFEPRELAARLQTILRRGRAPAPAADASTGPAPVAAPIRKEDAPLRFEGGLVIDRARRQVHVGGREIVLTGTEFELLHLLAREPGRVFSRDDILNALRGHEADVYTRAVDIVVSRLRQKLEPLQPIKTLRHAGYTLAMVRMA